MVGESQHRSSEVRVFNLCPVVQKELTWGKIEESPPRPFASKISILIPLAPSDRLRPESPLLEFK